MSKTNSFVSLKTVAITVVVALTMWSLGLPSFGVALAANVTGFSDTLSDSAPNVAADHTIEFVTPSGMDAGGTITITLTDFGDVSTITSSDLEFEINGATTSVDAAASGSTWGVSTAAEEIQLTSDTTALAEDDSIVVRVGENASGTNQITNPTSTGSYPVQVDVDSVDSGETRVAITDSVTVTASVDTVFTFTVAGVGPSELVNGATTTGSSTATAIPFGTLEPGVASTTAQDLSVETNAANGFVVTVQTDQQLQSSTGAVIDGFIEGSYTTTPTEWAAPNPVVGETNTYGHWGLTTNDSTVAETDIFDVGGSGNRFVSASTSPVAVFASDGPADGSTQDIGTARVGYQIEISTLQPAGDDYTATLTYVATPVF